MTITVELDSDIALRLQERAQSSGESVGVTASRVLAETIRAEQQPRKRFEVKPFALDIPEKWRELTPTQMDYEMEMEAYEEKLESARHESAQAANLPQPKRFVVKPIEGMRLPPEWTSGCVQELLDILDSPDAR